MSQAAAGGETVYDLAVIGGGSGGMATAKRAAKYGAKVVLFDYVKPSPQGTKWGLGGTCVNVGCVPKKLMHYAGLIGSTMHNDAKVYGWQVEGDAMKHDWNAMKTTVQNQVKSLNFSYKTGLRSNKVEYINALASFTSPNQVTYTVKENVHTLTAKHFVIAPGGRPTIPDIPGAEHCITSDDIFSLKQAPGKTLCVGAGYIALECAGFLTELGHDTTVAIRSIPLRGFDRQCADKIVSTMHELGTTFKHEVVPSSIVKSDEGLVVSFADAKDGKVQPETETFDTVLFATGRTAETAAMGLDKAGVDRLDNGKLECVKEQTNVPHIYAVGDVLQGKPELTPVAIQAGEMLADRLFGGKTAHMDYDMVATTVFTPFEYGCVGLSEEAAIKRYGEESVETYLFEFMTLEHAAAHRLQHASRVDQENPWMSTLSPPNLSKLVCLKSENERVVGFHYVGPNAGEITQGFALAVRLGAKKSDFDSVVGIHPSDAESFTAMDITRASGENFTASGMCGGGKCG